MPPKAEHLGTTGDGRHLVRVSCAVETDQEGNAPEWLHVMPGGPFVVARDGRAFQITDAARVVTNSPPPILLDWEHNSEKWDGSTEAAGWGEELYVEPGGTRFSAPGIWMRMTWADKGKADVASKAYRFLSPVLVIDAEERDVLELVSVALTNRPALHMQQIGQFRERLSTKFGPLAEGYKPMDPIKRKALCSAFGIAEDASDDALVAAANKSNASKELCSTLQTQLSGSTEEFSTKLAAKDAEIVELKSKLAEAGKTSFAADVKTAIADASRAGKVTPASAPNWEAYCLKSPENFEMFKSTVLPSLPVLGEPAPASKPADSGPTSPGAYKYTPGERASFKKRGMTDAEIDAAEKYQAESKARRASESDDEEN